MDIEHVKNQHVICGNNSGSAGAFGIETARAAAAWHATFPEYEPTPLVQLDSLARNLGVGGFYVKDESKRFGLNAFKVLGGSYAMGKCIADILGMSLDDLPYGVRLELIDYETRKDAPAHEVTDTGIYRHFCLEVEGLEAFADFCKQKNVPVTKDFGWVEKLGCNNILIIDPNGVEIELIEK